MHLLNNYNCNVVEQRGGEESVRIVNGDRFATWFVGLFCVFIIIEAPNLSRTKAKPAQTVRKYSPSLSPPANNSHLISPNPAP